MFNIIEEDFLRIIKSVKDKKLIIYGTGKCAKEVIRKLKCLDVEVAYCVDDELSGIEVETEVRDIYSLLLEREDFYVYIAKNDRLRCSKVLEGLGLKFYDDFNSVIRAKALACFDETPLDISFGYGMQKEETGVKIFGDIKKAKYVIAILGGSTSDPCHYPWKSWGECLWEYNQDEWAVIVGAVVAYGSAQELIKMLRDIMPMKPDLIISYSGVNEYIHEQPYISDYQRYLFGLLGTLKPNDKWGACKEISQVTYGVKSEMSHAERWISNQRIMYVIAKEFGIEYKAFFQPALFSKQRGIIDNELYFYCDSQEMHNRIKYTDEVRKLLDEKKIGYIEDATEWLDNMDGLFFDFAHVYEEGNRLIAEKVYQVLFGQKETM